MRKNVKYVCWRHPRTRNEMKANQEGWERAKRRPHLLPDTYDDLQPYYEKSWKTKRKTQYYQGGRGKKHSIEINADLVYEWDLSKYFKEHDIPYHIEHVCNSRLKKFKIWKRISKGTYPVFRYKRCNKGWDRSFSHYAEKYEQVCVGWKRKPVVDIVAYRLVWWSDKDIGIDYILKQCRIKRTYSF